MLAHNITHSKWWCTVVIIVVSEWRENKSPPPPPRPVDRLTRGADTQQQQQPTPPPVSRFTSAVSCQQSFSGRQTTSRALFCCTTARAAGSDHIARAPASFSSGPFRLLWRPPRGGRTSAVVPAPGVDDTRRTGRDARRRVRSTNSGAPDSSPSILRVAGPAASLPLLECQGIYFRDFVNNVITIINRRMYSHLFIFFIVHKPLFGFWHYEVR